MTALMRPEQVEQYVLARDLAEGDELLGGQPAALVENVYRPADRPHVITMTTNTRRFNVAPTTRFRIRRWT